MRAEASPGPSGSDSSSTGGLGASGPLALPRVTARSISATSLAVQRLGKPATSKHTDAEASASGAAAPAAGEEELLRCAEACRAAGLHEEARRAEARGRRLAEARAAAGNMGERQRELLAQLAAAAELGEPGPIRAARDAARAGQVPKKAIARLFALHSHDRTDSVEPA
mmetsp:Transcript_7811/g.24703  ORF Transcript_7811/g.24703 Transcript_7811/m.24703 type:complete len:169 (+) Transcript_7811:1520-2026(+)